MQDKIGALLKNLKLGTPQTYRNVVIFPLHADVPPSPRYITLGEALESHELTITEVSQGGSVPELQVQNGSETMVLLLDGEEVAGAKQNRVLNTTILVPAKTSVNIPVSCTEQGRWQYATDTFYDSGHVMARSIRAHKSHSVSESLQATSAFHSNQGEVWNGIRDLQEATRVSSPTGAMRDVFASMRKSLDAALAAFPCVADQVGLLVLINGEAQGFDFVSQAAAYARLHQKLVKSYVMDALISKKAAPAQKEHAAKKAQDFLEQALRCEEKKFKSVGHGDDYRFKGNNLAGSALVYDETVIHVAFFWLDKATAAGRMSGLRQRRSYRVD